MTFFTSKGKVIFTSVSLPCISASRRITPLSLSAFFIILTAIKGFEVVIKLLLSGNNPSLFVFTAVRNGWFTSMPNWYPCWWDNKEKEKRCLPFWWYQLPNPWQLLWDESNIPCNTGKSEPSTAGSIQSVTATPEANVTP